MTHKEISGVIYKKCLICRQWFKCNTNNFYKNNSGYDKLSPYCKSCEINKSFKYAKKHPEKIKQYNKTHNNRYDIRIKHKEYRKEHKKQVKITEKQWRKNYPEKLKQYSEKYSNKKHNISSKEWVACKNYFKDKQNKWCCAYCGITEKEAKENYNNYLHKEHVDPNGANDLSNCVPACKSCNSSKGEQDIEEWYRKQNFFNKNNLDKIHKWIGKDYKKYIHQ